MWAQIPSDDCPFNEAPDMKAFEITEAGKEALLSRKFDMVRVNYANPDMVRCANAACSGRRKPPYSTVHGSDEQHGSPASWAACTACARLRMQSAECSLRCSPVSWPSSGWRASRVRSRSLQIRIHQAFVDLTMRTSANIT